MQYDRADYEALTHIIRQRVHILDVARADLREEPKAEGSACRVRSPFRADKDPSLVIYPSENRWFDYGIGKGGDVIDWYVVNHKMKFRAVLYQLAKRAGVDTPTGALSKKYTEVLLLEQAYQDAQSYFLKNLTPVHRQWLAEHYGFNDRDIQRFGFGYDDGDLFPFLKTSMEAYEKRHTSCQDGSPIATGLFTLTGNDIIDNLRGRITIPIFENGRIVSFIGRSLSEGVKPKYCCLPTQSSKHPYISPRVQMSFVVGIDSVGNAPALFCTEGVMDCLAVIRHEVPCISPAGLGFAPKAQDKVLELVRGRDVILCFDRETTGRGRRGALHTANLLSQTANVTIADLPPVGGLNKVDLAEYLKRQGTNGECFTVLVDLMCNAKPFYPKKDWDKKNPDFNSETISQKKGEINLFVDAGAKVYKRMDGTAVSTFVLYCKEIRTTEDGDDVFVTDMHLCHGKGVHKDIFLPAVVFSDTKKFEDIIGRKADASWTGKKTDLLAVKRILSESGAPRIKSTSTMGLLEQDGFTYWISPDHILSQDGAPKIDNIKFTQAHKQQGSWMDFDLHDMVSYDQSKVDLGKLQEILRVLPNINEPSFIHTIIGWFMAAPLKAKLMGLLGYGQKTSIKLDGFPILWVFGSPSSGKSYTMEHVMLPLLGVQVPGHFSAGSTPYPRMALLSSTNAIPIVLDEYRRDKVNIPTLHQHLRMVYRAGMDARGSGDGSIRKFFFKAPVCVCGEDVPHDHALVQRIVIVQAFRDNVIQGGPYFGEVDRIKHLDIHEQAPAIIKFLLRRDTDNTLQAAGTLLASRVGNQFMEVRTRHNALAILSGAIWFDELCDELKLYDVKLNKDAIIDNIVKREGLPLVSEERGGLDYFFECLCSMINDPSSPIRYGTHYRLQPRKGTLILPLRDVYALYNRWAHTKSQMHLTESALRGLMLESERSSRGYVVGTTKAKLGGKSKHVTTIDVDMLNSLVPSADEFLRENLERLEDLHKGEEQAD